MSAWSIEWAAVPSVCRRIAVLFAVACLGAGLAASLAIAQDAGDQQYQDPFGGSTTTKTTSSKPKRQTTTTTPSGELTPAPQTSGSGSSGSSGSGGSSGTSGSTAGTTTTPAAPAASSGGLPNTGVDARVLLLAGGALLLLGLGIRLRSTPERF